MNWNICADHISGVNSINVAVWSPWLLSMSNIILAFQVDPAKKRCTHAANHFIHHPLPPLIQSSRMVTVDESENIVSASEPVVFCWIFNAEKRKAHLKS